MKNSDPVGVQILVKVPEKYLFRSLLTKNTENFVLGIFLSKPQAWHIITARSAVHIISPFGAVSHHAPACIHLRLDDIQWQAVDDIPQQVADDIHAFWRNLV